MCEKLCVSNVCLGVVDECVLRYFPPAAHYFTHSSIHAPLKCSGELIHLHTHTHTQIMRAMSQHWNAHLHI